MKREVRALTDMSLKLLEPPRTKRRFTVEDFRTQLYFVLCEKDFREVTAREEIAWGQREIDMTVIRQGFPCIGLIFDRPEGGERLFGNEVKHVSGYTLPVHIPGDVVHVINFMWPY
jgi:hypothetical protein